jgi:hypothetical protein
MACCGFIEAKSAGCIKTRSGHGSEAANIAAASNSMTKFLFMGYIYLIGRI